MDRSLSRIIQEGSSISGTFVVDNGGSGNPSGRVSGSSISFNVDQQNPCDGSYSGSGSISEGASEISGSYSGSDCNGTLQADLDAVKR